eukprot:15462197-Alexandrium_andersonii.AAC.1
MVARARAHGEKARMLPAGFRPPPGLDHPDGPNAAFVNFEPAHVHDSSTKDHDHAAKHDRDPAQEPPQQAVPEQGHVKGEEQPQPGGRRNKGIKNARLPDPKAK